VLDREIEVLVDLCVLGRGEEALAKALQRGLVASAFVG
jgi:hypothetical protein